MRESTLDSEGEPTVMMGRTMVDLVREDHFYS
jgi:hypothetical protein